MTTKERQEYRAVLKRDNGECIICLSNTVAIHHVVYRSLGGITDRRNMVCLCPKHHAYIHSMGKDGTADMLEYLRGHYGMIEIDDLKRKNRWVE